MSENKAGMPSADDSATPEPLPVAPPSGKKPCPVCGNEIPAPAIKCTECDSPLGGKACVSCGAPMPPNAERCWRCQSFQNWRRHISVNQLTLALLASILSIAGLLAPQVLHFINLRSRTSGFFLDIDQVKNERHFIIVRLTNGGGRSSQVEDARIDFKRTVKDPSRVQGTVLDVMNRSAMIVPAAGTVDLELYADNLTFVGAPIGGDSASDNNYKRDVAKDLCTTDAVLTINVRERDRLNRLEKPQPVTIAMTRDTMEMWVLERTTGQKVQEINCP